ncbi:DNA polymerase III subunit epsilon [Thioclava dalianensis]|uniref:DNA-directed DNA polymerase n=1 Tax=Thioclava dalianensis TaxID=1185766 RepID=A0A074TLD2_9RHOB|nr:exonuclease domain-containing protein [Thioclava dalianensis]KEP69783.1 DNA polymerase III subunit epsilon [Thioclava dalianensis]SFM85611.1 DNA polymerase-3 subunit epsilon [Thioclava dalianensis]
MSGARFSLRLRVLLLFAALAVGVLAALAGGLILGYTREPAPDLRSPMLAGGIAAGFVSLGLIAGLWLFFDTHLVKPVERLAGLLRAHGAADAGAQIETRDAPFLGDLTPAAGAMAQTLSETRHALNTVVARETTRLAEEKERLEALLADVPVGVLLCTAEHQIAFYNGAAVDLLGSAHAPGLDRRVFEYLTAGPISHAYERLGMTKDPEAATDLLCATVDGGLVLAARMRRLAVPQDAQAGGHPGYVLTLRDVSGDMATHHARTQLIDELFERIRRPAAALQSLIDVLTGPDEAGTDPARDPIRAAARSETRQLSDAIHDVFARHEATRADWWPLSMIRASDLGQAVAARVEAEGGALLPVSAALMLRCEGFELVALLANLARHLRPRDNLRLEIMQEGVGALIALEWVGAPVEIRALESWLDQPLDTGGAELTGRRVLQIHATEIWPETLPDGRGRLCLPLREARHVTARPAPATRRVVYDFDLLARGATGTIAETPLADLTYVVFDTETTGLAPEAGDEIVQIAAVRIVNGRRVAGEVFDMLVDPGRPIPAQAAAIHGISDAMVQGACSVPEAVRQFHRFAEGAVLVAHNAPFDMAFLTRRQDEIGARFDNPVLDTVLLSAVVFGQSQTHTLDALAHRLGITIPEEARHTALGDTVATAEAFLKLSAVLQARGLTRFGAVLAELRKHSRLLRDLNG